MQSPQQVRHLTEHFRGLQGLRQVPFGLVLLFLFGIAMWFPSTREELQRNAVTFYLLMGAAMVSFAPAFVAYKLISDWYGRRFGYVEPSQRQRLRDGLVGGVGTLLFVLPSNLDGVFWVTSGRAFPLNLAQLTFGIGVLIYGWYLGRSTHHYLVLGGIGIVLGLASAAGLPPATWPWHLRESLLYAAAVAIIGGLLDHRILVRTLTESSETS